MSTETSFKRMIISVNDISCANCAFNIENALKGMDGIESVSVYVVTKMVVIKYDPLKITADIIKNKIKSAGYTPGDVYEAEEEIHSINNAFINEEKKLFTKFIISASVSLILFIFKSLPDYVSFIISVFVWGYCGYHFHKGFIYALKNKTSDMNTLVSLSSTVMIFYISYSVFFKNHIHFFHWHEISMLIAFINLGRYFESKTKYDVSKSIEALKSLFPDKAVKITDDGRYIDINVSDIKEEDIILLKPGSEAPVDGYIIEGSSNFDLSVITGESLAVFKKEGDFIYAGSLNKSGAVKIKCINSGSSTMIYKLLKAVTDAQSVKLNIQKKVDKIAKYFVPAVILISLISSVIWIFFDRDMAVNVFASVLAVSCPCAMGLSVPVAVMSAISRAVKLGFIINNPSVIENFSNIDTVILDKTGTLTDGKMYIYNIKSKIDKDELVRLLYTAELNSEHLFSDAVKKYAELNNIKPLKSYNFKSYSGKGIEAETEKGKITAGSPEFFKERDIDFSEDENEIKKTEFPAVLVSVNDKYIGYVIFGEKLRDNAKDIVERFKKLNIMPVIASGDLKNSVKRVAEELDIKDYYYEVKPDEKQSIVLKYKISGRKVVMIGDGINDAAALGEADIGISMGSAKDMVAYSSDMVLLSDDISTVFKIIKLVNSAKKVINQNLLWAFGYNAVLIPVAAGVLYPFNGMFIKPYMAAVAMGLSSVSVVLNSMRLLRMKF